MIMDYTKIKSVDVHRSVLEEVFDVMRRYGNQGSEVFFILLGKMSKEENFIVSDYVIPIQYNYESPFGIGVYIPPEEIESVNRLIYESGLFPLGQIHSHPSQAYHSHADNEMSMIKSYGQFSIVVPYFAMGVDAEFHDLAVFRLHSNGDWMEVNRRKKKRLFKVIDYDG